MITTVYYGASAETVRGFLTTPIERAVSAISGVDYVESTSRAGVSTVTVRLKLNHNSTAALAEVTARLQQVRSELPAEAEPPVVEVQRADRPYASFYLSFTSSERDVPADHRLAARARCSRSSRRSHGVQRVDVEGGRPIAMRVWIDPDRLAALNLAPGDVHAALQRNNYLAAVGQTKGNLVQVNLLANTDLRSVEEFDEPDRRRPRRRHRAAERRGAGRAGRRGGRPGRQVQRQGGGLPRRLAAGRASTRSTSRTACATRWSASARRCPRTSTCGWPTTAPCSWSDALQGDHQDAGRDDPDRRPRGVPVHGLGAHRARAAGGDAGLADRRRRS